MNTADKRLAQCLTGIGRLVNPQIVGVNVRAMATNIVELLNAGDTDGARIEAGDLVAYLNGTAQQNAEHFAAMHCLPPVWVIDRDLHAVRDRVLAAVWPGGRVNDSGNYVWRDGDLTFGIDPSDNWRLKSPSGALHGSGLAAAVAHQRLEWLHEFIAGDGVAEWRP